MKVKVTTKEKQFDPIELKLTIESKKELTDLRDTLSKVQHSYELFELLDNLIEK